MSLPEWPATAACHSFACAVIDGLPDQMAVLGADGTIVAVNQAWRSFADDNRKQDAPPSNDVGTDYLAVCRQARGSAGDAAAAGIHAVLDGSAAVFRLDYDCHGPDRQRWFRMAATPLAYGWPGAVVVHHDITAQREAEAGLRIAAVAIDSFEGRMVTDAAGTILRVNRGVTRITGYDAGEAVGRNPSILNSGRHDAAFYLQMWSDIRRDGHWQGEIWNRRKNGQVYPEYLSIAAVRDPQGTVSHYVAVLTDITQRKADSEEIRLLAFYDPLTRLPNRRLLLERLSQQLRSGGRRDACGALFFIDLDNFKSLNDRYGHNIGDLLLEQVARRLLDCVREGDTVARLGGDEFVVLCDGLDAGSASVQATALGSKLLASLNAPYLLQAHRCSSTPSIGVTLFYPGEAVQADALLVQADTAMYQAKRAGRNNLRFFDQAMQDSIDQRAERVRQLRGAFALRQFELHYQLQLGKDGSPCGAEALLRWRRGDGELETAPQFASLAEEAGLLERMGDWMLDQACAQLRAWSGLPLLGTLVLTVGLGASHWRRAGVCQRVGAALARHGADPARLRLALPDPLPLAQDETAMADIRALGRTGVRFLVTQFGTSYDALLQLRHLPLDQMKIGASLVGKLGTDDGAPAVVRALVALAGVLRLGLLAEGVDTAAQRALLRNLDCHCWQGNWHSPPLPLASFEALTLRPAGTSPSSISPHEIRHVSP